MKIFMLSLVMLIGVSFAGNAEKQKTTHALGGCTDCWSYANKNEGDGGYAAWQHHYDHCNNYMKPCAAQLDPVIITN